MRYYYNRKATADESRDLRIYNLKKWGMLSREEAFRRFGWTSSMTGKETSVIVGVFLTDNPCAVLMYSMTDKEGNKTDYNYPVSLVTTPCYFGGVRYWFTCPDCWSRVGVLYLAPGDVRFRCRHCNNLSYHSRNNCTVTKFGITGRQIDQLRSEIKRWTWAGRPTRKVRRLQALERKMGVLSGVVWARTKKWEARLSKF